MTPAAIKPNNAHPALRQAGFSLVEILVGLVIGLLATLVIMQVFAVFEGQKRTSAGTADAQTNGSIALYTIARELSLAGYGLMPIGVATIADSPLECATLSIANVNGLNAASGIDALSPVIITDGGTGAGASDSITIHYGDSPSGGISVQPTQQILANTASVYVPTTAGCSPNDIALFVPHTGAQCALTKVTAIDNTVSPPKMTINSVPLVFNSSDNLACLGTWHESTYSISSVNSVSTMVQTSGAPNTATQYQVVSDIVNIQAQYGVSATANSNLVVNWVNAANAPWTPATLATDPATRNRIKAVHIAVVARNGLLEKAEVTSTCKTAKGTNNNGPCAWDDSVFDAAPVIDLTNDANWKHYRYRVFDTIIPLRNVLWSKSTL